MLHKCANPECVNPFRRLSEGKLFLVRSGAADAKGPRRPNRDMRMTQHIEHFWLCDRCAGVLTLSFEQERGMVLVPLPQFAQRKAPAHVNSVRPGGELACEGGASLSKPA